MPWLVIVSFIWAFSPVLIQTRLNEPDLMSSATVRLVFALLVFAPLLRPRMLAVRHAVLLVAIGGVQFGLMYACYMSAFRWLRAEEVFLFTVSTPLFVALADSALALRPPPVRWLAAALLAAASAAIVLWQGGGHAVPWAGFLLVQASNLCFALGQLAYKRLRPRLAADVTDSALFGWLMLGGAATAFACTLYPNAAADWGRFFHATNAVQWTVLAYLGIVASGLCFFLWNRGALQVHAGRLAVFNNLKIPLGVACSVAFALLVEGEPPDAERLVRLALSLLLILAALRLATPDSARKQA